MRRAGVLALALTLVWLAGCGGSGRDPTPDPFDEVRPERQAPVPRSAPRWSAVATIAGSGPTTKPITILRRAIQWRVRWRCRSGRLVVRVQVGPALARSRCPDRGMGASVETGPLRLTVAAKGSWRIRIEQQLDTPLREPPLPSMADGSARRLANGGFYSIEQPGRGVATLYHLPDDRLALRLTGFETAKNRDLFVWLSRARRPTTSTQAFQSRHLVAAPLKSTLGDQNYLLPRGLEASSFRSIVIWCQPLLIAYTAATLGP